MSLGVVSLSSPTNAHIGAIGDYPTKVYCEYNGCSQFDNKVDCNAFTLLPNGVNCSWTPPGTTVNPSGGYCGEFEMWNVNQGVCEPTSADICTPTQTGIAIFWSPWNVLPGSLGNVDPTSIILPSITNPWTRYCSQVTRGASYGFWYDVNVY